MNKYLQHAVFKVNQSFYWEKYYKKIKHSKKRNHVAHWAESAQQQVINDLKTTNIKLENFPIDLNEYEKYVQDANYCRFSYQNFGKHIGFPEKSLEHFAVAKLLKLNSNDCYIDIASCDSPVPEIYKNLFGCITYKQDLIYPSGLHGTTIGGDASSMPIPDCFVNKMGLHCSLEHFESNSDTKFVKEAERVLKTEGKVCVAPLYLYPEYAIQTNPILSKSDSNNFDDDATIYCVKDWKNRHSRFYDVKHLMDRIINQSNLKPTLYISENEKKVHPRCYLKFSLVLQKKR